MPKEAVAKWDAWNECKGMKRDSAREFFIETAEDQFKNNNMTIPVDPKKAQIEKDYDACVKRLEDDEGIKKDRIEAERQRRIDERKAQ